MSKVKFLDDVHLLTGTQLQIGDNSTFSLSGDNLVINNSVGDIVIGDGTSDIYVGDGTSSVNILFEQSGAIKAEDGSSNVTLTLGSSDTSLTLVSPTVSGNATFAGTITTTSTATGAITLNGGTGVATTGAFILRQNGDGAGNGMAITSSHATSHRIWKDASGNLNIGSSSDPDAFQQDISGNATFAGNLTVEGDEFTLGTGNYEKVLFDTSPSAPTGNGSLFITPQTVPGSGTANFTTWFRGNSATGTTKHHVQIDGNTTIGGAISASNLSGTNTGDQDLSGYVTLTGSQTISGSKTFSGGISGFTLSNGISGSNFNITGVNQLSINDPGEGILFGGGANNVSLYAVDDDNDNIINFSGAAKLLVDSDRVLVSSERDLATNSTGTTSTDFVTVYNVNGGNLASHVRLSVTGTTGNVVVSCIADIIVNHSQDIFISSMSGNYTQLDIKVISNDNEDFAIECKRTDSQTGQATLRYSLVAFSQDTTISQPSSHSYTGATHTHRTKPGTYQSATDGADNGYFNNIRVGTYIYHDGDTDTSIKFDANRVRIFDGGGTYLDTNNGSAVLHTSTTFSGDVSGTYDAIVVADDSHNHVISNIDGLQTDLDNKTDRDDIRSLGTRAFTGGTSPNITTTQLFNEIDTDGGFDSYSSVFKTSWSYAGNYNLNDAGRFTETAGTSWITWTDNSSDSTRGNVTALAICPTTGGSAGKVFIYNHQGSTYSPGWREVWTNTSDGSGSGLDADVLDGQQGAYYLDYSNFTNTPSVGDGGLTQNNFTDDDHSKLDGIEAGADVTPSWVPSSNPNYISSLNFSDLSSKGSGTGNYSTSGYLEAGRGSGGVALTHNDGYGNANVTFNHVSGTPEQAGSSGRIVVTTDSTTAKMSFELKDNVSNGTAVNTPSAMEVSTSGVYVVGVLNLGDSNDTTLSRHSAGNVSIEGNKIWHAGGLAFGYTESGKNYPVELDGSNAYVNVPWTDTDTNTTYSAGSGMTLSGTTFNANINYISTSGTNNYIELGSNSVGTAIPTSAIISYKYPSNDNIVHFGRVDDLPFAATSHTHSNYITSNANDNVTGHTEWQDGYNVRLGNSADMRLYHTGGHSYIDNNTGNLYIRANVAADVGGDIHLRPHDDENGIIIYDDAGVELYYNNAMKLTTSSGGISVTGSVIASGNIGNLNTTSDIGQQLEYGDANVATLRCDANRWRVYMGGSGNSQETLTVAETGRVGINDSTPDYTLDVSGNVSNISIYASHDVAAYSDARVKTDIKTIPNALDKVNKLRGVTFKRTDEGSTDKRMMGVIAQEVLDIIPEVVNQRESDGHYSVSYGNIVGVLIEAVKELTVEVEELKKLKCKCNGDKL